MSSEELRKLLYERKQKLSAEVTTTTYEEALAKMCFQYAVELLWPLVEAHIKNANQDFRGNREQSSVNSFKALADLKEKLKGG